ncbi:hypothetical protein ACFLWZ_08475 [Chloroflexota bacterium]
MKKIGKVSPSFGWRAWLPLLDEDSGCYRVQRQLLTAGCHGYIICGKSDEGMRCLIAG